ncbi:MAG: M48 family metallopeptidase [Leptolyngbyaceae bacterium]|nr:M48 family metallopeptidase [Leptolyngbyaceae bacterium]
MLHSIFAFARHLRRRWAYSVVSLVVAMGIIVGSASPSPALPSWLELLIRGVQVIQLSTISDRQEVSLGEQINAQLVRQEFTLYNNSQVERYVNQVGQRLVPASTRPDIPYTFQVVQDDQINAFATMGGYVYVTTGLLQAADNEAQMASVLAHEIGHIASRHAIEQMREQAIARGLMSAAGVDESVAVNIGVELAVNRRNSRADEREADQLGLNTLRSAGYAPSAMVAFMEKLLSQGSPPTFLSTHPSVSSRIEDLQAAIDPATANVGDGLDEAAYRSNLQGLPSNA